MEGWFLIHRKMQNNWIWKDKEPFDKRSAWIDLISMAYHSEQKVISNGTLLTIQRGQFPTSVRFLAERWKWSKDRVYRFLKLLEQDGMIVKQSDTERTLITLVNYGIYQDKQDTNKSSVKDTHKDADKDTERTGSSQGSSHEQIIINNSEECLNEKRKEMMRERSFDFERFWHFTADAYPKQRKVSDAKDLWIDEILKAPIGKEEETARIFHKAIEAYKEHMEGIYSKPDDRHNATPQFREWILSDSEQWLWKAKMKIQAERAEKEKAAADNVGMTEEEWNELP